MEIKIKTEWHDEMEAVLLCLENCKIECEGMSAIISVLLNKAGINHTVKRGHVKPIPDGDIIVPHVWIALDDGWIIDLRLRYWLGDYDSIPHGIFHPEDETGFEYHGVDMPISELNEFTQDDEYLLESSDGKIKYLSLPKAY